MSTDDTIPPQDIGDNIESWIQARLGKVTASRVADVVAITRNGPSERRKSYMVELIAERLTGMRKEQFLSQAMMWGVETEHDARQAYERHSGNKVAGVWFVDHAAISMAGASPDGLVGAEGLVEIKCPTTQTHVATLLTDEVPDKHIAQMQWQMACTGRKWCDFVSFDPRIHSPARLFVRRVMRDNDDIAKTEAAVRQFLTEIDAAMERLGA